MTPVLPKAQQDPLEAEIRSGRRPLLLEADRFRFACTSCGKCCFGRRIRLTPTDVGLMATGAWARAHGIATTSDLHARRLLERFFDPDSKAPVCMIRVEAADAPCPFLVPDVDVSSRGQRIMMDQAIADGRHPVDAARRAGLTPSRLLCGLHEDGSKPMVCKSAPLGRVHLDDKVGYVIEPPHPECPGMNEPAEWTVGDWIRESRLEVQFREVTWFTGFMDRHGPRFASMEERRLTWIGEALYNPDGVAMHFGIAAPEAPSRTLPLAGLMTFARGLAEAFASDPEEDFADPAVPARRAGDIRERLASARTRVA